MGYVQQKPVYGQKCVAWEREIVGWEELAGDEVDFSVDRLLDPPDNPFSDFDRDQYLPPDGWTWTPPGVVVSPPPEEVPEVPAPDGWTILILGACVLWSYFLLKSIRR